MENDTGTGHRGKTLFTPSNYFLFVLIIAALAACFMIIRPYVNPIILGSLAALALSPVHHRILGFLKNRKTVAAALSTVLFAISVIFPVLLIGAILIKQGISSFAAISAWIEAGNMDPYMAKAMELTGKYLPAVKERINPESLDIGKISLNFTRQVGTFLINSGKDIAGNISDLVIQLFFMLFTFFFFIWDEKTITNRILHLVPLSSTQETEILDRIKAVTKSAVLGTFLTAMVQGALGGIAFAVAGLPVFFWGIMMAFASLIPVAGVALIWVPACFFLFVSGKTGAAIFMAAWCAIVVSLSDNLVRPLFMQGSAGMGTFLIFFAIIGGLKLFGLTGLVYGPLLFGITAVLLYIYQKEFAGYLKGQDNT
ncbi:MAG: AI-2E family transporter [Desulfarculaceae bacterium]|nr:AI-2E family transporter [Desulfarculaceae bacterium]